jgi:hypothetical protein
VLPILLGNGLTGRFIDFTRLWLSYVEPNEMERAPPSSIPSSNPERRSIAAAAATAR